MTVLRTVNPANEKPLKRYKVASQREILRTVDKARKSFASWSRLEVGERADLIASYGRLLKKRKREWGELITAEMGKPITQSISEIEKCAWLADIVSANAERWLADESVKTEHYRSYIAFRPLGVVACIMPWNFPFWQALRFGLTALAAGNTAVLKHSSTCPGSALAIVSGLEEAGFPKGVLQTVIGGPPVGEALVNSAVDAVSVTGSVATGRRVYQLASAGLKKCVLELGGSDPFVVLGDADLNFTCQEAVRGRIIAGGQSCIAAKRFIVVRNVAEAFTEKLLEFTRALKVGDPMAPKTDVGPMVRWEQVAKLQGQVRDSLRAGAKLVHGGEVKKPGFYYVPAVLTNVRPEMRVFKEETFGPVSPIIVAKDEADAIRLANATSFGLGASVWTRNLKKGDRIAKEQLEAGIVYVNGVVRSDPRLPFGGVKNSGIGRELARYGMLEFTNIKSIIIPRGPVRQAGD